MVGGALSVGTISAIMSGCKAEPVSLDWEPKVFSQEQAQLVTEIAERIIPETDTPGAKEAGVPSFVDNSIHLNIHGEDRKNLLDGLLLYTIAAEDKYGKSFIDLSDAEKDDVIRIVAMNVTGDETINPAFKQLKELVVVGYFTSEVGAKSALAYDPIPGEYKGCIDFKEVGKAYAI